MNLGPISSGLPCQIWIFFESEKRIKEARACSAGLFFSQKSLTALVETLIIKSLVPLSKAK